MSYMLINEGFLTCRCSYLCLKWTIKTKCNPSRISFHQAVVMCFFSFCQWFFPYFNYFGAYVLRWDLIKGLIERQRFLSSSQRSLGAHYNLQRSLTSRVSSDFQQWLDSVLDASVSDSGSMSLTRIKLSTLIRNEIKLITINTLKYLWKWVTAIRQLYTNEENQRLS